MPRTAITVGLKHGRKSSVLIYGPETPLLKQRDEFRNRRMPPLVDKEFCEVTYQESDSHQQIIRFLSPKEHEAFSAERKAEQKKVDEFAKNARAQMLKRKKALATHKPDLRDVQPDNPKNPVPTPPVRKNEPATTTQTEPATPTQTDDQTQEGKVPDAPEGEETNK